MVYEYEVVQKYGIWELNAQKYGIWDIFRISYMIVIVIVYSLRPEALSLKGL
jgi:hypothetical protein